MRPFEPGQFPKYFDRWVDQHKGTAEADSDPWTADAYVKSITGTPGLSELAQTPFVLRALADALPRLERRSAPSDNSRHAPGAPAAAPHATEKRQVTACADVLDTRGDGNDGTDDDDDDDDDNEDSEDSEDDEDGDDTAASHAMDSKQRRVTRADVYAAFIDQCWEVEARRLRRNWPPGLPPDYDAELSFTNYSTDLAVDMLSCGQVS